MIERADGIGGGRAGSAGAVDGAGASAGVRLAGTSVSRRVAVGAAWAAPVVVVSMATPAAAASVPTPVGEYPVTIEGAVLVILDPYRDTEFEYMLSYDIREGRVFPGDDYYFAVEVGNPSDTPIPAGQTWVTMTYPPELGFRPRHLTAPHGGGGDGQNGDPFIWKVNSPGIVTAAYRFEVAPHQSLRGGPFLVRFTRPAATSGWTAPDGSDTATFTVSAGSGSSIATETFTVRFPTPLTNLALTSSGASSSPDGRYVAGVPFESITTVTNTGTAPLPVGWALDIEEGLYRPEEMKYVSTTAANGTVIDGWSFESFLPGPDDVVSAGQKMFTFTRTEPLEPGASSVFTLPLTVSRSMHLELTAAESAANTVLVERTGQWWFWAPYVSAS